MLAIKKFFGLGQTNSFGEDDDEGERSRFSASAAVVFRRLAPRQAEQEGKSVRSKPQKEFGQGKCFAERVFEEGTS